MNLETAAPVSHDSMKEALIHVGINTASLCIGQCFMQTAKKNKIAIRIPWDILDGSLNH